MGKDFTRSGGKVLDLKKMFEPDPDKATADDLGYWAAQLQRACTGFANAFTAEMTRNGMAARHTLQVAETTGVVHAVGDVAGQYVPAAPGGQGGQHGKQ